MDNIGDWLYIIFLAIVVIVSYASSIKKKNQDETVTPPPPSTYEQAPPPVRVPPRVRKKASPPVPERVKQTGGYVSLFQNEGQRAMEDAVSLSEEETNERSLVDNLQLNNADDFRKAVIYAEILNRKY
jgi:hypothetical protein